MQIPLYFKGEFAHAIYILFSELHLRFLTSLSWFPNQLSNINRVKLGRNDHSYNKFAANKQIKAQFLIPNGEIRYFVKLHDAITREFFITEFDCNKMQCIGKNTSDK